MDRLKKQAGQAGNSGVGNREAREVEKAMYMKTRQAEKILKIGWRSGTGRRDAG
jgi:hypothetical protein